MAACSNCNKPCFSFAGKCLIAQLRIELDCTFEQAFQAVHNPERRSIAECDAWQKIEKRFQYIGPSYDELDAETKQKREAAKQTS